MTPFSHQARLAQWQSGAFVSQWSQVLILLVTNFFLTIKVVDIFCKICKQYFCMICGDFPVNSKLITYKAYMVFVMQYLLVYQSENLWGFQVTCNTCNNYVLIAGYPALHGVLLYFLRGKHLQCRFRFSQWCFSKYTKKEAYNFVRQTEETTFLCM